MPKIVLSYRRADSLAMAGRIRDRLAQHYGSNAVFRDLESIPIAEKFPEVIQRVIGESDVMLSLVGPDWTAGRGEAARINQSNDPVRLEIETALKLEIPIIPILIGPGSMPQQLPASLDDFSLLNAARVDPGNDFDHHMRRLIAAIDKKIKTPQSFVAALLIIDGADSILRGVTTIVTPDQAASSADAIWATFGLVELFTAAGLLLDWPLLRWVGAAVCACGAFLSLRLLVGAELSFEDSSGIMWFVHQGIYAGLFTIGCAFCLLGWQTNIGESVPLISPFPRAVGLLAFVMFVVVAGALSIADTAAHATAGSDVLRLGLLATVIAGVAVYFGRGILREWQPA
jgi:hypothetical protein